MEAYNLEDFDSYFRGAWIVSPSTGKCMLVAGLCPTIPGNCVLSKGKETISVPLREISWRNVQVPRLGYRHLADGRALYFVERKAIRDRRKVTNPDAIKINVPTEIEQLAAAIGDSHFIHENQALGSIAESIFSPVFVPLREAIEKLSGNNRSIGFALSHKWAITVSMYEDANFLLLLQNSHVASSKDGYDWKWHDEKAKSLFNNSMSGL